MKILSIDDDPFYEKLYRDIFETGGMEFEHAFTASDGLEIAKRIKPDLITLDVMMPEKDGMMDGFGMIERLRNDDDLADMPIVMISALDEDSDVDRAMKLGATAYLPKQKLTPDKLVELAKDLTETK